MALQFDNVNIRRKNPIKRNSMFFSKEDYDLEMMYALQYMEHDAYQTVIIYEVDMDKTMVNDVYKEADKNNIRFKTPVEIPVIYDIADSEIKSYNSNTMKGIYAKTGKLTFSVLLRTLEEYECDIKRGDYVGIQITPEHIEYFTVTDDGKVGMTSNGNTIYGTVPFYRKIEAAPIDATEFNG